MTADTTDLSNVLADKAERVKQECRQQLEAERASSGHALAAGALLVEARDETAHGQWAAFLARAGVHERQARRLMQLARSGLTPDTVSDLGGLKASLAWLATRRLPGAGEVLVVSLDDLAEPPVQHEDLAIVWPAEDVADAYGVALLSPDGAVCEVRRPVIGGASNVWGVVDHFLKHRHGEMTFHVGPDALPRWASVIGSDV